MTPGDRVVLDFSQRLKSTERLRAGLLGSLSGVLAGNGLEVLALVPRECLGGPDAPAAQVIAVDAHSDILYEEVQLPLLLKRLEATRIVTFREGFRSRSCHVHLHLHEDPQVRRRIEPPGRSPRRQALALRSRIASGLALRSVGSVTTSSLWTYTQIERRVRHVPPASRGVALLGGWPGDAYENPLPRSSRSFLLASTSNDPRDEVSWLIAVYQAYAERVSLPLELIFYGSGPVPAGYRSMGFLSTSELKQTYARALAYLHPSAFEGFGLQIVESLQVGTPVVARSGTAVDEVAGPFVRSAVADAAAYLQRLSEDEAYFSLQATIASERGSSFSWSSCAAQIAKTLGN